MRAARALIGLSCLVACARTEAPGSAPAPTAEAPAADTPSEDSDRSGSARDEVARRMQPVVVPAATTAHEAVQNEMHGGPLPDEPLLHYREVEGPASGAAPLARFHEALSSLARGEDADGKVRVAVYGSSSTAADRYTGYLRRYLQARFGDGGPGFVAVVPPWRWHRHDLVSVEAGKPWAIEHAQKKKGRLDGRYGLPGASAYTTKKRARASLEPKSAALAVADLELWFLRQPRGGSFTLEAGGREHRIATAGDDFAPGYFDVPMKAPGSPKLRITTKGDGEVRLFGAVLETDDPGVVVDNLGLGGTRAANHLAWDEALWLDGIRRRAPDLYVLAYGANESIDEDEPIETYRANLGAVLGRFRQALPGSSCLLVGPQDYPMQEEGAGDDAPWLPRARLSTIVDVQRDVAGAAGCGFFDMRAMMGGEGSMEAWVAAEPPLAKPDHLHLTPLGYLHLGRVLSDAIMADYDRGSN